MKAVVLAVLFLVAVCLASPHNPYGGFYPHGGHHGGFHHHDGEHHHGHGCKHSQEDKELTVREKYPFMKPTLFQLESGKYAPKQMKEMQDEVDKSVQVGIQIWNRNSGGERLVDEVDVEVPIDIRFANETKASP